MPPVKIWFCLDLAQNCSLLIQKLKFKNRLKMIIGLLFMSPIIFGILAGAMACISAAIGGNEDAIGACIIVGIFILFAFGVFLFVDGKISTE